MSPKYSKAKARQAISLQRQLTALIAAVTFVLWVFAAVVVYHEADRESNELFDNSIAETAQLLLALSGHELQELSDANTLTSDNPDLGAGTYMFFQIWNPSGVLLYKNNNAPDKAFTPFSQTGFAWATIDGKRWRTYALNSKAGDLQIQVGEPVSHRREISVHFAQRLALFGVFLIPIFSLMVWFVVREAFRPVRHITELVLSRSEHDLSELPADGLPSEISPLVRALNQLFGQVQRALEREKFFTSDAAHELRTPLAGIKTNVQILKRSMHGTLTPVQEEVMCNLGLGADRCTHLIDQLLTLARVDEVAVTSDDVLVYTDLEPVVTGLVGDHQPQASKKNIALIANTEPVQVAIEPTVAEVLIRNLIDNALRYVQQGGRIEIGVARVADGVRLVVSDNGPGISGPDRQRIFDRFFRVLGHQASGSGLGLSIVQRVVQANNATIEINDGLDGRGVSFVVLFQLPKGGSIRDSSSSQRA